MVQRSGCWQWLCYTVYPCIPCFQTKSSTFVYNLDDLQIEFFAWMITLSRAELKVYIHFLCGFISSQPARTTWSIFHVLTSFSIVCLDIKICQSNSKHHCWLRHAEQCWPAAGLQDLCSSSFARGGVGQLAPRPELLVKSVISEYQRAYFKKEKMHEHVKLPANVWLMGLYHSISRKSCLMTHALTFLSSSTDQLFEMTHVDFRNLVLQASLASGSTDLPVLLCRLSTGAPNSRAAPRNCCWLSVIGYSLRKSCRGILLRCRESRWSRLWVMCGKSWKVGHKWHALHWNSEATNRWIIQRDQGDQGEGLIFSKEFNDDPGKMYSALFI